MNQKIMESILQENILKKYPKYKDIIPIFQFKKGFIDEDGCLSIYFNIKDDPTGSKRMLNLYILNLAVLEI